MDDFDAGIGRERFSAHGAIVLHGGEHKKNRNGQRFTDVCVYYDFFSTMIRTLEQH